MSKKISIIIVTYNSCGVITECLESIHKYNDITNSLEIIVVDNSPHTDISKVINELNIPLDITYIHNPENGGFGQGNNIGAKVARGELLFILNPDTILVESIFKFMLDEFTDQGLTAAGFRLIDREGNDNDSVGLLPEYNYIYLPRSILNYLVIKLGLLSKYIFPWGADLIVRRVDFLKAGMFDERIFLCNEEPDLISRLNIDKVKIFNKCIIHLEGHTTDLSTLRYEEYLKSTKKYLKKVNKNFKRFLMYSYVKNFCKIFLYFILNKDNKNLMEKSLLLKKYLSKNET